MKPPKSAAMKTIRAGLIELLNDPGITDRARLRQLEQLSEEIEGFIFDLRARFPEPRSVRRSGGWWVSPVFGNCAYREKGVPGMCSRLNF
jgi:hypothetical protein